MSEAAEAHEVQGARRGREARRAARAQRSGASIPYITRNLPLTELLSEEAMQIIEHNAETLLEEIGIEFRDYPRALELLKGAGADVKGERRALSARPCPQADLDRAGAVHAASPATRSAPSRSAARRPSSRRIYGSPFVHDLDKGRRYGTIEDFRNFVKLAYMTPAYPPFGRHGVRAGRPAGQQAPPRDGLCAYALFRQAVHGLGDASRPRRSTR